MRKRGFTLIELIVVMAIIAILILLGVPKYKEYTKEAQLTKIKVSIKELETASQKYYMVHSDWPRLNDASYTKEQIEGYANEILSKTGETIELDIEGHYYDIDYIKLGNYITKPQNNINYILQNPIGSVYYLKDLTESGKERVQIEEKEEIIMQNVIWDETDKYANLSLSEGGLHAANLTSTHGSVKSTIGKTSGKWYWEVKVLNQTSQYAAVSVGVSDSSERGLNAGTNSPKSVRYFQSSSVFKALGTSVTVSPATIKQNDVLGIMLDMDSKEIEFRVNNITVWNTSIEGYIGNEAYALVELYLMNTFTNFGNTPFVYEIPESYKPYALQETNIPNEPNAPNEPVNIISPVVNGQLPLNVESITASSYLSWGGSGTISHIYYPWEAFDGKYDIMYNGWAANSQSNAWLQATFKSSEEINMVRLVNSINVYALGEYRCKDFRIEYYDEVAKAWKVAFTGQMKNQMGLQEFGFESVGGYKQWRLWIVNHGYSVSAGLGIGELQFLSK